MTLIRELAHAQMNALGDDEVEVILSTSNLARDGHILVAGGANLSNFKRNPIVLWGHNPDQPIGRCDDIAVRGDKIVGRVRFAALGASPTADMVRSLVKTGIVSAVSVGFDPTEMEPLDRSRPRGGQRIRGWELRELSFVSVPADPDALVTKRANAKSTSIRTVEAQLRAGGMSASEAKRLAADWQQFSETEAPKMSTLSRAMNRLAPNFAGLFDAAADRRSGAPTIHQLQAARAALLEGPDASDADNFEADLALAREGAAEIDRMIAEGRARQAESARTARPVEGQDLQRGGALPGGTGPLLRNVATGQLIRSYRHDEPMASIAQQPDWGLGDVVRAACTGDWGRLPSNVRAGAAGIGVAGGFLIPSELSGYVVDLARAKARVLQAGAITAPMDHGSLSVAVVTADPQAAWKAENAAFATAQGSYGRIELSTRTLGVIVPLSLELVMSASNLNEILTRQITERLGLQIDTAAISGDGTINQPRGILSNIPADNIVPVGAELSASASYGFWSSAIGKVLAKNAQLGDLSILHNSDVDTALDGLTDTLMQPLRPTPNFASIKSAGRSYVANGIGTAGSPLSTYSIVGDFSQCLFGMQQSLSIEVSREGGYVNADGTVGNAFSQGQVLVRAFAMLDVAILRPSFFAQVSDIRFS